jgi:O-antigen/teichoic acid export membrane protein
LNLGCGIIRLMGTFLDQLTEEKGKLKLLREDRGLNLSVRLNLVFLAVSLLLLVFSWQRLPPQVPLFFSHPWGESQLIPPIGLFLLPLLCLFTFIINFLFLLKTLREEKILAWILAGASLTFTFLCLVALYQIIRLVL